MSNELRDLLGDLTNSAGLGASTRAARPAPKAPPPAADQGDVVTLTYPGISALVEEGTLEARADQFEQRGRSLRAAARAHQGDNRDRLMRAAQAFEAAAVALRRFAGSETPA